MGNPNRNRIIVAVHGVGSSKSGEIAKEIAQALDIECAKQETIVINNNSYQQVKAINGNETIIEVNWSDILKPTEDVRSILKQIVLIIASMLSLAEAKFNSRFIKKDNSLFNWLNPARLIRFLQEGLFPAAIFFVLATILGTVLGNSNKIILLILLITFFFSWFVFKASKYSKFYLCGLVGIPFLIAYMFILHNGNNPFQKSFTGYALQIREWIQIATSILAFIIFIFYLVSFLSAKRKKVIVTEFAFTYMPFIAFNSAATIITFLSVGFLNHFDANDLAHWEEVANKFIPFNLYFAEVATTIVYSIIGIVPVVCFLVYVFGFKNPPSGIEESTLNKKGEFIQKGLAFLLKIAPVLLLFLTGYLVYLVLQCRQGTPCTDERIWKIYKISILRTLPFFTWLLGPLSIMTGVIGDILFYIQPNTNAKHAIQHECQKRFRTAVEYAKSFVNTDVIIIAHSWGTVVANDYLVRNPGNITLITLGSPLETLCQNFIGNEIEKPDGTIKWINAYRYGDYVAGPIDAKYVQNLLIGNGGHTGYWNDRKLKELLLL